MKAMTLAVTAALCLSIGCGARSGEPQKSECEEICEEIRPKLINNFGVPPEDVDCSDSKWEGDCWHCEALIRKEFSVQSIRKCS